MGVPGDRPKTISAKKIDAVDQADPEELADLDLERPAFRSDCVASPRPCPFVGCKHHLYLEVNPHTGSIQLTFPEREIEQLDETCSLDVAARDGATLERVGHVLNLTRERIRQIEVRGLLKLRGHRGIERAHVNEFGGPENED